MPAIGDESDATLEDAVFETIIDIERVAEGNRPGSSKPEQDSAYLVTSSADPSCLAFPTPDIRADDDRELMIIRRDRPSEAPSDSTSDPTSLVKRVEYQELFAQLRKA
jgi:hypothetical protein